MSLRVRHFIGDEFLEASDSASELSDESYPDDASSTKNEKKNGHEKQVLNKKKDHHIHARKEALPSFRLDNGPGG